MRSFDLSRRLLALLAVTFAATAAVLPAHAQSVAIGEDNAGALRGSQRVAILQFGTEFYRSVEAVGRGGGSTARVLADLAGVDEASFQAVADRAYQATVDALTAAGFQVVPAEEVRAQPLVKAYEAKHGKPAPLAISDDVAFGTGGLQLSGIHSAQGRPAYFASAVIRGDFGQRVFAQNAGIQIEKVEIAKALNAVVLDVHYLAAFATLQQSKNGWIGNLTGRARAAVTAGPVLQPEDTQWQFVTTDGPRYMTTSKRAGYVGALYLKEPLSGPADLMSLKDITDEAERDRQTWTNFLHQQLGTKIAERKRTSVVSASSDAAWREAYGAMIEGAARALAQKMAEKR